MTPTTERSLVSFFFRPARPPRRWTVPAPLDRLVLVAICGTIAGADDFVGPPRLRGGEGGLARDRLGLKFPSGVPRTTPQPRSSRSYHPAALHECLLARVEFAPERLKVRQIAIDGKAMRGSGRGRCPAVAVVSAWATRRADAWPGPAATSRTRSRPSRRCWLCSTFRGVGDDRRGRPARRGIAARIVARAGTICWPQGEPTAVWTRN